MKLRRINLKSYKRFADLTVENIPQTARLVLLAGPNGCGKSSLFDALSVWHRANWAQRGVSWDPHYHSRIGEGPEVLHRNIMFEFHEDTPADLDAKKKAVYIRTAYRNDPAFELYRINRSVPMLDEERFQRIIENDASVQQNYERLISSGLMDLYEDGNPETSFDQYRAEIIGPIKSALLRLFPDLELLGVGNPLQDGTFRFKKGLSNGFLYKNLSGGEKAAFDLILDMYVKGREYNSTIFCIDEPDAHMSTKLQAELLDELWTLLPDNSQLWLATHSVGMMRRARDLYREYPDQVIFLDFGGRNFDGPQVLTPVTPDRKFWSQVFEVALGDIASLVAPETVVICEGTPDTAGSGKNAEHDARCLDKIFAGEMPETQFLAGGNASDVERDRLALARVAQQIGVLNVIRLVDRDDRSNEEVEDLRRNGVRVLSRRNLECYLFDDEVLEALCVNYGGPMQFEDLLKAKRNTIAKTTQNGAAPDDLKKASGIIYGAAIAQLKLKGKRKGSDARAFMRDTLAPLVTPDRNVYKELKADIFGCDAAG